MDLRVTSVLLVLLALAEATPDRYYHKVSKTPYPVKSHGKTCHFFVRVVLSDEGFCSWFKVTWGK